MMTGDLKVGDLTRGANVLRTDVRRLLCKVSEEEVRGMSMEMAQTFQDVEAEEERQVEQKAVMKAKLSALRKRIMELSGSVVSGHVARDVEVDVVLTGIHVQEVRVDTGEIVFMRPATTEELQAHLPEDAHTP